MSKLIDLTDHKFTLLTVLKRASNSKHGTARWLCQCTCGNKKIVLANNLKRGLTKSCGCLHKEIASHVNTSHGLTHTVEYRTWARMKARCCNQKNQDYKNYGGRGIKVCIRWLTSFENFLEDMGKKPNNNTSIDRIDNNGNYNPSNCRWATKSEQMNNRRPLRQTKLRSQNNTGFTGISFTSNKYRVRMSSLHIGYFETLTEAIAARVKAEIIFYSP